MFNFKKLKQNRRDSDTISKPVTHKTASFWSEYSGNDYSEDVFSTFTAPDEAPVVSDWDTYKRDHRWMSMMDKKKKRSTPTLPGKTLYRIQKGAGMPEELAWLKPAEAEKALEKYPDWDFDIIERPLEPFQIASKANAKSWYRSAQQAEKLRGKQ